MDKKTILLYSMLAIILLLTLANIVFQFLPVADVDVTSRRFQRFAHILTDQLLVLNDAEFRGDVAQEGDQTITGDFTVTDNTTLGDAAGDTLAITGDATITGHRDGTTGRDYFLTVSGDVTGAGSDAKTYGIYVDLERTAANTHGNITDAGLLVRYKNSANDYTAGIVSSGADIEVKNDDGHHTDTLRGAQITAVTDATGGTDTQIALRAHAESEGVITTTMQVADFELNRKNATDPTNSYGLNIRNTSSAGGGADVALRIESSYGAGGSAADDDWSYLLDLSPADATIADIRLQNGETISNAIDGTINIGGNVAIAGARDATADRDYFLHIAGDANGLTSNANTWGIYVDLERTIGNDHGNIIDAGAKIYAKTSALTDTSGIVLNGVDAQAKADDNARASVLRGGQFSVDTDIGSVTDYAYGLRAYVEQEGNITTTLNVLDVEVKRKDATDPTYMWGVNVRNTSELGGGMGAAYRVESSGSGAAANDDWLYGLDMNQADIATADIRLSNGETILNTTDTAVQIGGFLALTEGSTIDLANGGIITATASYQPLTCAGAEHSTTNATTAIADGPVAGSLLVLCNEDATYNVVIKDGANTKFVGDVTLTAGADDCLTVIWNGVDWVGLSFIDN